MKYGTSQFHDWIYKNSLAEYKKYSKILKNPKDDLEEIGFRISSVRCSFFDCKKNTTIYVIGTLSNNGKCPKNAFVKDYEANIKINGQTPEIMYIEFNGTSSELENHGIGSLGLDYVNYPHLKKQASEETSLKAQASSPQALSFPAYPGDILCHVCKRDPVARQATPVFHR